MASPAGDDPRDEKSGRFLPESDNQEILKILEEEGGYARTGEVADALNYTANGALKRLRKASDFIEEDNSGRGSASIWELKYERKDFINALKIHGDLTPTEKIADEVDCPIEVAEAWLDMMERDGDVASKERAEDDYLWSRTTD